VAVRVGCESMAGLVRKLQRVKGEEEESKGSPALPTRVGRFVPFGPPASPRHALIASARSQRDCEGTAGW